MCGKRMFRQMVFSAQVSPQSWTSCRDTQGIRGSHLPCTEGKPNAKVQEHDHPSQAVPHGDPPLLWGTMLDSPNSHDICLLTKACISAALTWAMFSCFFFFSQSKESENVLAGCQGSTVAQVSSKVSGYQDSTYFLIILLFLTATLRNPLK